MPEWMQLALGQFGALVIMIIGAKIGFTFLKDLLDEQKLLNTEQRELNAKQSDRYDELHTSTIEAIHANTMVLTKQAESLVRLYAEVGKCPLHDHRALVSNKLIDELKKA